MEIKEISLSKIKRAENYRIKKGDVADLMSSIKENGLLQPVGVKKDKANFILIFGNRRFESYKKLGRKTIPCHIMDDSKNDIIINLIENIQRKDTTLFEVGRAIFYLRKEGLSDSEISIRLGVSKTFIKSSIDVYNMTPVKFRDKVVSMDNLQKTNKQGMIASTVASTINSTANRHGLSKKDIEKFYDYASKNDLSAQGASTIVKLMGEGLCLKDALASKDKVKTFRASIVISQDEYDRLINKYGKNFVSHLLYKQTYDKVKPISRKIKI